MRYSTAALLAVLASTVSAQAADWQQCGYQNTIAAREADNVSGGGMNWSGETICGANAGCVKIKYASNMPTQTALLLKHHK